MIITTMFYIYTTSIPLKFWLTIILIYLEKIKIQCEYLNSSEINIWEGLQHASKTLQHIIRKSISPFTTKLICAKVTKTEKKEKNDISTIITKRKGECINNFGINLYSFCEFKPFYKFPLGNKIAYAQNVCVLNCSVMYGSLRPHGLSHSSVHGIFQAQNTEVGCHFLL